MLKGDSCPGLSPGSVCLLGNRHSLTDTGLIVVAAGRNDQPRLARNVRNDVEDSTRRSEPQFVDEQDAHQSLQAFLQTASEAGDEARLPSRFDKMYLPR